LADKALVEEELVGRFPQPIGTKGSLRWIQYLVNKHPAILDHAIGLGSITWLSPLVGDDHAEYRDGQFIKLLSVGVSPQQLRSFWPNGGHNGMP